MNASPNRAPLLFALIFLTGCILGSGVTIALTRKRGNTSSSANSGVISAVEANDRKMREVDAIYEGKKRALADVRSIGLGLISYAHDYDDAFPPHGADIEKLLVKEEGRDSRADSIDFEPIPGTALDLGEESVEYLMVSPWITGTNTPAEQAICSKRGPGGKAIVYADGHTKWKPYQSP